MGKDIEEEFDSRKVHFERRLRDRLEKASELLAKNKIEEFTLTIRALWLDCFRADKKAIIKELKQWEEEGKTEEITCEYDFREYVEADPNTHERFRFKNTSLHRRSWIEIYQIMQEALKKQYTGQTRKYEIDEEYDTKQDFDKKEYRVDNNE